MSEVATSEATASNIKPPIIIPETSSDIPISEVSPTTGDSYLTCNCNQCEGRGECVGRKCGTSFRMSSSGEPIYDNFCVNETTRCSNLRTPITCCDVTKCNGNIQRGTTTTGSSHITRTHLNTDYHRTGSTGERLSGEREWSEQGSVVQTGESGLNRGVWFEQGSGLNRGVWFKQGSVV